MNSPARRPAATGHAPDPSAALRLFCVTTLRSLDRIAADEALSAVQWFALRQLARVGCATSAALARDLDHDAGAMVRVLDGLVARGLIDRQRSTADRREVNAYLTAAGAATVDRLEHRLTALDASGEGER